MSRKDYIAIAKIMRNARKFQDQRSVIDRTKDYATVAAEINYIESELSALFRADNPAFDEVKFLKACRS